MALSPEYTRILDLMRMRGEDELKRTREDRLSPLYERVGLRSPQVAQQEQETISDMVNRLSDTEIDLLLRQVQRGESLEDIATQMQHQIGTQQRGIMGQSRLLGEQAGIQEQAATTAFERQQKLIRDQRQYDETERERQQKEQQKSALTSLLMSVGLGAATGGLGLIPGVAKGLEGVLSGAVMGGPASGQMAAYGLMSGQQQQQTPLQFGTHSPMQTQQFGQFGMPMQTSLYPDWMQPGRRASWL